MNRTMLPTQPTLLPPLHSSVAAWQKPRKSSLNRQGYDTTTHSLFSPIHYESGYAYPLLVWLHSSHSSESELRQVMALVSTRNFVGVAPRGTFRSSLCERRFDWEQSAEGIAETCQRVRHCIEIARNRVHIHVQRIFIAGYGIGGTMALRVGFEHPELFAGAISLGGRVPRGCHAFRRINAARNLPLMLSVSPTEDEFSHEQVLDDLRLLHSGGFSVSMKLYPDGDSLTDAMLADVNHWMMSIACPGTVASTS